MKKYLLILPLISSALLLTSCSCSPTSDTSADAPIEPQSIDLIDVDEKATVKRDVNDEETGEKLYDYYFTYRSYDGKSPFKLKAVVKPDNTSYPSVKFAKDEKNTDFEIQTHETNPDDVEEGFCLISLLKSIGGFDVISTPFYVETTNPGTIIRLNVCVTFAAF